ncbi:MAG: AsnC family transcriptional regulator [Chloroflexota bacterium]
MMSEFSLASLSIVDRQLLNLLQSSFPLVREPFQRLGRELGLSHKDTMERVRQLRDTGLVRYVSGIFNPDRLGYHRALIAMKIPEHSLPQAVTSLEDHPGVSHNYGRDNAYNLWFTLNLPSTVPLEDEARGLAATMGAEAMLFLPTMSVFKIGVYFDMVGDGTQNLRQKRPASRAVLKTRPALSDVEMETIRRLQDDLATTALPFAETAASVGMSENEFLSMARTFLSRGVMRRYGAVLRHQQAGFTANAMGCWAVPQQLLEAVGKFVASFPNVSHCYERLTHPDWPYNLFTMIHGHTREECQGIAADISNQTGIAKYELLFTTVEYKRSRMRYFA